MLRRQKEVENEIRVVFSNCPILNFEVKVERLHNIYLYLFKFPAWQCWVDVARAAPGLGNINLVQRRCHSHYEAGNTLDNIYISTHIYTYLHNLHRRCWRVCPRLCSWPWCAAAASCCLWFSSASASPCARTRTRGRTTTTSREPPEPPPPPPASRGKPGCRLANVDKSALWSR